MKEWQREDDPKRTERLLALHQSEKKPTARELEEIYKQNVLASEVGHRLMALTEQTIYFRAFNFRSALAEWKSVCPHLFIPGAGPRVKIPAELERLFEAASWQEKAPASEEPLTHLMEKLDAEAS